MKGQREALLPPSKERERERERERLETPYITLPTETLEKHLTFETNQNHRYVIRKDTSIQNLNKYCYGALLPAVTATDSFADFLVDRPP